MIINASNKEIINTRAVYIHDSIFTGFIYDYRNRQLDFTCENFYYKVRHTFVFKNVVLINMQSCSFWHSGRNILDMSSKNDSSQLEELIELQNQHQDLFQGSYLDRGIPYIIVEILINSGDTLQIVCESIDYNKESFL